MTKGQLQYWLRIVVANAIAAVAIVFVFSNAGPVQAWRHWRSFATAAGTSFLFAMCIGPMLGIAMPRLAPIIWRRLGFPLNWIAIAVMMVAFALLGSAVAILILIGIGYVPAADFGRWYLGSARISIAVTLTIGLFITAFEMNKARLAQASAEARLASLEARVQPHFLFNTLNAIAALTHDDPARAEKMTTDLAALLRSSMDHASPLVTLDEELRTVRTYLEIERVRFGDRLRYRIDADAYPHGVQVPRLAVQTLVENAIKYAVAPHREGATMVISAVERDGRVRITVVDDGPGFDPTTVPEGHGLALLRSRLELLFHDRASLIVHSRPGETSVGFEVQP